MGRPGAWVLSLSVVCWSSGLRSAEAQEPPPLVFFHAADPDSPDARSARAALAEVAARRGTVVIDLSPQLEAPGGAGDHLRRGIEAYRHFDYEEALDHLEKGVAEASATGALGLSHSELSDLLIYRALALGQLGDAARAWDDFVRAAAVDPTRKLDPVRFAPRVVETFDRAVQAVAARAAVPVRVEVGDGCEALFDGRPVASGASLSVPEGEHYARVSCEGMIPYGGRVLVRGDSFSLRPELERRRVPRLEQVVAEAETRGASELLWCVLARARQGGATLSMRRIATASGKEKAGVLLRLGGEGGDRAAVSGAAARLLASEPRIEPIPLRPRPTPWYRRPWFWAAVGAAAASAVLLPFAFDSGRPTGFDVRVDYPR